MPFVYDESLTYFLVLTSRNLCSEFYRAAATPRRHNSRERANNNRSFTSNEINPPEVLANRDTAMRNKLRRNKKQQVNRENKSLMRSRGNDIIDRGEMDMDSNPAILKKRKRVRHGKKVQKQLLETSTMPTSTSTEHPNDIAKLFHPHRHNHQSSERELTHKTEPTMSTTSNAPLATSTAIFSNAITSAADSTTTSMTTSTSSAVVTEGNLSDTALKLHEKVRNDFTFLI